METVPLTRILVVEDDQDIRELLELALTELGHYEVLACARGDEALEAARGFRPELVLLDSMLPGLDGTSVLHALKEDPQTAQIPVVFLTARTRPADLDEFRRAGALRVIPKPFEIDVLCHELDGAWADHQTHAA